MLLVNQIIPFSNVDGDGNRCSIFLQECNIKCLYCHNSETINQCIHCGDCVPGCPTMALAMVDKKVAFNASICIQCDQCIRVCQYNATPKAKSYSTDELIRLIEQYKPYIRGITVSGGEPTLQSEGIIELFEAVRPLGLSRYIDTNGFIDLSKEERLIGLTDGFLYDVKALTTQRELCGVTSEYVLSNLRLLADQKKLAEVRTVVFDGLVDVQNVIMEVAEVLATHHEVPYRLIRGHLTGLRPEQQDRLISAMPSEETMVKLKAMAEERGLLASINL